MTALDRYQTTAQAASALGVSTEQVRELIRGGKLRAVKVGREALVDSASVRHRAHVLRPQPGRPLSPRMAWAVLWMASARDPGWVSAAEKTRARKYLARHRAEDWPRLLAQRADLHVGRMLTPQLAKLRDRAGVVSSGISAISAYGPALLPTELESEFYLPPALFDELVHTRRIMLDTDKPNVLLRVPRICIDIFEREQVAPRAVVAADLLDSGDERQTRAAHDLLSRTY